MGVLLLVECKHFSLKRGTCQGPLPIWIHHQRPHHCNNSSPHLIHLNTAKKYRTLSLHCLTLLICNYKLLCALHCLSTLCKFVNLQNCTTGHLCCYTAADSPKVIKNLAKEKNVPLGQKESPKDRHDVARGSCTWFPNKTSACNEFSLYIWLILQLKMKSGIQQDIKKNSMALSKQTNAHISKYCFPAAKWSKHRRHLVKKYQRIKHFLHCFS